MLIFVQIEQVLLLKESKSDFVKNLANSFFVISEIHNGFELDGGLSSKAPAHEISKMTSTHTFGGIKKPHYKCENVAAKENCGTNLKEAGDATLKPKGFDNFTPEKAKILAKIDVSSNPCSASATLDMHLTPRQLRRRPTTVISNFKKSLNEVYIFVQIYIFGWLYLLYTYFLKNR